ncbi:ATP-dependent zinc metalloprotease FtsH [Candidatus Gracilibacteria bacterium]|nr:ATP-dependent zinc metalloprotease FtsH [Candidatus Gracilibacteria bacterium]
MNNKKPNNKQDKKVTFNIKKNLKNNIQKPGTPSKNNPMKIVIWLVVISLAIAYIAPNLLVSKNYVDKDISLSEFRNSYNAGLYKDILIDGNKAIATLSGELIDNGVKKTLRDRIILPQNDSLKDLGLLDLTSSGNLIQTKVEVKDLTSQKFWEEMLPTIILFILFVLVAFLIIGRMGGVANNAMSFGKSRARLYDMAKDKVLFADVAGAEEEKVELTEIVDFLKNPQKYKDIGAKIPKGVLLVGPPGTGKTLIARAVAGESGVPFLSISGSEFVEMFVGVGASRVRDLFEQAKKLSPSIIFIDEIDAIGKKRGPGLGGGHDEREQTLNQILTEMDGFDGDTNIIIMAATNRADVLDKALLRPGRFDRKVTINLPNLDDREKILKVHSKNKPIANDVDFREIASKTVGFSGADLGNLINESAIITARKNEKEITSAIITESFEKIVMGLTKKSQVMNDEEKKITAYHEVGHALVGKLLPNTDPVHKVSIISRGGALGVTWFLPERDRLLVSKAKYLDELATLYGGRVAEEVFFGKENITTGASNDIEKATSIARDMVMRYGMFEDIGAENFAGDRSSGNHLGSEGNGKIISDKTQDLIDAKVKEVLTNAYNVAKDLITKNKDLHIKISEDLLSKEEINKEEFDNYFV